MKKIVIVLLSFLFSQFSITIKADITYNSLKGCRSSDLSYTQGSVYEKNLNLLFDKFNSISSTHKFYNYTIGDASNQVYGLFQCRNDIGLGNCNECVKNATRDIVLECPSAGEGIVWYEECMLRYANRNIFALYETSPLAFKGSKVNVSKFDEFSSIFANTMNGLIKNASSGSQHFASGKTSLTSSDQLYSFAQCTPDIDTFGCSRCLKIALTRMISCCNASAFVMIFYPSCQLRYDTTGPFLKDPSSPALLPVVHQDSVTEKKTSLNPAIIAVIVACASVGLLVVSVVLWICFCRKKPEEVSDDVPPTSPLYGGTAKSDAEGLGDKEFEQYSFKSLRIATSEFSNENKLGEGGFGIVYKGTLKNGEQLAIKRLSQGTSGQGTKEFMTEARLLAKLQHRNLVRLLGFCSEGDEKLLVYEFMSNASLDGFLFDPIKRPLLGWGTRSKIIIGIAKGLQYLHDDSRLTIIHRDLKPGNILLDKEMNPKIADFGLAKLSEGAQKFGNTVRIAGTQGYMAPEYLMTGEYSDKSDVYSYGIMLLEIVSGQRNRMNRQTHPREDLSIQAWRLWNEERSFEITDPILFENCPRNEVTRYIQIGLLCVQANAEERPTMAAVVFMLTCATNLPLPSAPMMTSNQNNMPMNYNSWQQSSNQVYGLFQCRNDIGLNVCNQCVKEASQKIIEKCPLSGEGIVWYDECMLRYANRKIFSSYETLPGINIQSLVNVTNYDEFAPILATSLKGVIKDASSASPHYASRETNLTLFDQLYSFAQCTPDIDSFGCNNCLKFAMATMVQCCNKSVNVMVFTPSCQLRYDRSPFLKDSSSPAPPPAIHQASATSEKVLLKPAMIGAIAASVLIGMLVLTVCLLICLKRNQAEAVTSHVLLTSPTPSHGSSERFSKEPIKIDGESLGDTEFKQYDFNTLKIATRDFSDETMLGEGGFGKVYKGTLENGDQIAIKRLSNGTTGQGTKEFMTESRVLAKLQHRNLVKLLGFCSEGEEKLLVYEFLSNASLDRFLFDPKKRSHLDWTTRNKIIMGIARGLQYLHEDSRLTIIHRDLKPGNILLDEEMNPKVADFGLAKLFECAQKFGNTVRIVGTQGYMAPEYLMSGDYSAKSDVYSFGIMLLEIVSGQKSRPSNRSQQTEDLSIQAWRLWDEDRSMEITDPVLLNNCPSNEVKRCIQIGLLCIQANAEERPTMGAVVLTLTCSIDLPSPSPPMMTSSQYSMAMSYSADQNSTKSVTMKTDMGQNLYQKPR
ncbi:putative cysteine-rich receptor-like protein kinase 39 [Silene latifolia]|uniref:putative cysteine-rich receptor-like protein kinase 39 n=1 Tax=Silene latifolia TaxID=37657 RepID=UPI003D7738D0